MNGGGCIPRVWVLLRDGDGTACASTVLPGGGTSHARVTARLAAPALANNMAPGGIHRVAGTRPCLQPDTWHRKPTAVSAAEAAAGASGPREGRETATLTPHSATGTVLHAARSRGVGEHLDRDKLPGREHLRPQFLDELGDELLALVPEERHLGDEVAVQEEQHVLPQLRREARDDVAVEVVHGVAQQVVVVRSHPVVNAPG